MFDTTVEVIAHPAWTNILLFWIACVLGTIRSAVYRIDQKERRP